MTEGQCALYARVSSESQARDNTIASQVAALRERIAVENFQLEPDHSYVDEGYSGSILSRPALERLRDAGGGGHIERIYVHAPDRLARRYAHQVLLIDEFRRAGAEVVFLNRPIGGTAEDDLLLQVQGVIAEYERAKILERSRRGRRPAARSGSVSALTGAPFGYRYVSRSEGGGVARFEVVEDEARIVRLIFAWIGLDRMSLREVWRGLQQIGCQTRRGSTFWYASTIRSMLDNPAYVGRATFGRSHFLPPRPRLRPIRGHLQPSPRATSRVPVPREEWIEIPVPPLVDPTVFDVVRTQLEENRRRKRHQKFGKCWLLQGLTVCRNCGYAYYGKTAPRSRKYDPTNILRYYRCIGADGYRFNGKAVCNNGPVAAEVERNLSLVISRLEDFSAKVTNGLDGLDRSGMRDVIRILVRRIEIADGHIEVVFRVPSPEGSRSSPTVESGSWQHCTGVGRTNFRMARPLSQTGKGLRSAHRQRRCLGARRPHPHPHATARKILRLNAIIMSQTLRPWPKDLELFIFLLTSGWKCGLSHATQSSDKAYREGVL